MTATTSKIVLEEDLNRILPMSTELTAIANTVRDQIPVSPTIPHVSLYHKPTQSSLTS
jgi:hypothetical protein